MNQLPDVVERFIADVLPYVRDLNRAAREADEFGEENRQAAQRAHMFGQQAEEAGRRAAAAQNEANEAAERLARGQGTAEEASRLARVAAQEQERAHRAQAVATEESRRAERALENQHRALAREARAAAQVHRSAMGQMTGDLRDHDRVLRGVRGETSGFGRDGDRAMGMVADAGRETGGILTSVGSALTSNWISALVILVAGLVALPAIAVAVGGAITLALGGGIAALGIMAAAQNKKVKSAFSGLGGHVKKVMADISKPFQGTLVKLAGFMKRTFDSFAPVLKTAFAEMAPVLTTFFDQLFKSFEQLKPVIPEVTRAFTALLQQLGPRMPEIMRNIADAIILIVAEVTKHPDLFVSMIVGLSQLIQWTGTAVAALMKAYYWFTQQRAAMDLVKVGIAFLVASFTIMGGIFAAVVVWINHAVGMWKKLASAVKDAAGQIPKALSAAWAKAKGAHKAAETWLLNAVRALPGKIKRGLGNPGALLFGAGKAIIDGLVNGIRSAIGWLKENLSWVTSMIPSWKGPEDTDRKLLVPAGKHIMGGLIGSILSLLPALRSTLGTVTSTIALPGAGMAGAALAGGGPGRPGGAQVVQHFHIAGTVVAERQLIEVARRGLAGRTVNNPGTPGTSTGRRP